MKHLTGIYFCASAKDAKNLRRRLLRKFGGIPNLIEQNGHEVHLFINHSGPDACLPIVYARKK